MKIIVKDLKSFKNTLIKCRQSYTDPLNRLVVFIGITGLEWHPIDITIGDGNVNILYSHNTKYLKVKDLLNMTKNMDENLSVLTYGYHLVKVIEDELAVYFKISYDSTTIIKDPPVLKFSDIFDKNKVNDKVKDKVNYIKVKDKVKEKTIVPTAISKRIIDDKMKHDLSDGKCVGFMLGFRLAKE